MPAGQAHRLIVNTVTMMSRMVLTFGIGLVITRVVLAELGKEDFGLAATLSAAGLFLVFFQQSLVSSASRHMAHAIGLGDDANLRDVFRTALAVFWAAAVFVVVAGFALTDLVLSGLTIPADRLDAAWWVFHFTILSMVIVLVTMPYEAMVNAHQDMKVIASRDVLFTLLRLGAALSLMFVPGDLLIWWAALVWVAKLIAQGTLVPLALRRYTATRCGPGIASRAHLRELSVFAGWKVFQVIGWQLTTLGGVLAVNLVWGNIAVAALAVATQLSGYLANFSAMIARVVEPAVVSGHARQEQRQVQLMTLWGSKYAALALWPLAMPALLAPQGLLDVWLAEVPPDAALMVTLTMAAAWLNLLSRGFQLALNADGRIGGFTVVSLLFSAATLGLGYGLMAYGGWGPWVMPAAVLLDQLLIGWVLVFMAGPRVGLGVRRWLAEVVGPVGLVAGASLLVGWAAVSVLEVPWMRPVACGLIAGLSVVTLGWWVALSAGERAHFIRPVRDVRARIFGRGSSPLA